MWIEVVLEIGFCGLILGLIWFFGVEKDDLGFGIFLVCIGLDIEVVFLWVEFCLMGMLELGMLVWGVVDY